MAEPQDLTVFGVDYHPMLQRFAQIDQYAQGLFNNQQAQYLSKAISDHYAKYPWTNPGLAVAFGKWKQQYGTPAAQGLARTAYDAAAQGDPVKAAVEQFAMTNEFKRQVKAFQNQHQDSGDFFDHVGSFFSHVVDSVTDHMPVVSQIKQAIQSPNPSNIAQAGLALSNPASAPALNSPKIGAQAIQGIGQIPTVGPLVKGAARAGFTALESPYQEVQGLTSSYLAGGLPSGPDPLGIQQAQRDLMNQVGIRVGNYQPGVSTGAIALGHIIHGEPVDLGTGFMPGGAIQQEHIQKVQDLASYTQAGQTHYATPGRIVAAQVSEPGSEPFKILSGGVDAAQILTMDPVNLALVHAGTLAEEGRRLLPAAYNDAGAMGSDGSWWRNWTQPKLANQWLDNPNKGGKFLQWIANLDPKQDFLEAMRRTNWKIPAADMQQMLMQKDPSAVRMIFEPLAGAAVREVPNPWSVSSLIKQTLEPMRMFNVRPDRLVDFSHMDGDRGAIANLYEHMKNAYVPDEFASPVLSQLASARSGFGQLDALEQAMKAEELALRARGLPIEQAQQVTKLFYNDFREGSLYWNDQIAHGTGVRHVLVGGEPLDFGTPHLWDQAFNGKVYLPDPKKVDNAVAEYGRLFGIQGTGATDFTTEGVPSAMQEKVISGRDKLALGISPDNDEKAALAYSSIANTARKGKYAAYLGRNLIEQFQSKIWVPATILRLALPIRITAEQQAAMSAAGIDGFWSHPIRTIAWVMAAKDPAEADVFTSPEAQAIMARQFGSFGLNEVGRTRILARGMDYFKPEDARYNAAWANQLIGYNSDPVANNVARALTSDEPDNALQGLKDAFWGHPEENTAQIKEVQTRMRSIRRMMTPLRKLDTPPPELGDLEAEMAELGGKLADLRKPLPAGSYEGLAKYRGDMLEQQSGLGKVLGKSDFTPNGTREGSDAYIDFVADRLHQITDGHPDLLKFIATGLYGNEADQKNLSLTGLKVIDKEISPDKEATVVSHSPGHSMAHILYDGDMEPYYRPVSGLNITDLKPTLARTMAHDGINVDRKFTAYLNALKGDGVGPSEVIGTRLVTDQQRRLYDSAVQKLFSGLMGAPTNMLDRNPTFLQYRWQRVLEMMEQGNTLSDKAMVRFINEANLIGAEKGPVRKFLIDRGLGDLRDRLQAAYRNAPGDLSYDEADQIARGFALDKSMDILYDMHHRGQITNAIRFLMPFAEAWKQMFQRWGKIIIDNPDVIRKFQIGLNAARQTNPLDMVPGAVPDAYQHQGFFYKDPTYGESFVYPFSSLINDKVFGIGPIPFTGQASGLNLAFNVMPGVGPVAQVAGNAFMDKFLSDPKYDPIRELISPYGEPDFTHGLLESFAPGWMRKWITAQGVTPEDTRLLNNTTMELLAYGFSNGDYVADTQQHMQAAVKDAMDKARTLYRVRGTFQFGAPSAPDPQFLVKAKGKLVQFSVLRDAYRHLLDKDPSTATANFVNRFGTGAFYATQAMSLAGAYAVPFTKKQMDWERTNPDIVSKYPTSYGFWAPHGNPKDFDYQSYLQAIAQGARQPLDPTEWVKRGNNALGWMWYDKARTKLGLTTGQNGTAAQRAFLTDLRDKIRKAYPGWNDLPDDNPNRLAHAVDEVFHAANDPMTASQNKNLATAINVYKTAREGAINIVKSRGGSSEFGRPGFQSGQRYADIREFLQATGKAIVKAYPQFKNVWEQVFDREIGNG